MDERDVLPMNERNEVFKEFAREYLTKELPSSEYEQTPKKTVEEELLAQMKRIVGYVPIGTKDLLHVLKHPDLIEFTKRYIEEENG